MPRKIPAVTGGADPVFGFAGQYGPDAGIGNACIFNTFHGSFVDFLVVLGIAGAALMLGAMYLFSKRNKINYLQQLRSRA